MGKGEILTDFAFHPSAKTNSMGSKPLHSNTINGTGACASLNSSVNGFPCPGIMRTDPSRPQNLHWKRPYDLIPFSTSKLQWLPWCLDFFLMSVEYTMPLMDKLILKQNTTIHGTSKKSSPWVKFTKPIVQFSGTILNENQFIIEWGKYMLSRFNPGEKEPKKSCTHILGNLQWRNNSIFPLKDTWYLHNGLQNLQDYLLYLHISGMYI